MKRLSFAMIIALIVVILGSGRASFAELDLQNGNKSLSFESNILMSNNKMEPILNDNVHAIILTFNEEIDSKNLGDAIKLYKIDAKGNLIEEKCRISLDSGNNKKIRISNMKVSNFVEGEEYKLAIDKSLKSKTGTTLKEDYVGYFATNIKFSFEGNLDLNNERNQIFVISDMHMGVDDAFAEINNNKQAFVDFLTKIKNSPNAAELIIAGDMFDEWFLPMDYQMPNSLSEFHDKIVKNNKEVVDVINDMIKMGDIKVTYVSGNHDILLSESEVKRIFPGINTVSEDIQGLGTYITGANMEIAIEHSHRYNFFCAPDMISNRDITKNNTSILPPGYFFTRIATSSVVQGHPKTNNIYPTLIPDKDNKEQLDYFYYYKTWESILKTLPVKESLSDKVIKTNVDGFTENYSINDLLPQQNDKGIIDVNLFKDVVNTWDERQILNNVNSNIEVTDAIIGAASSAETDRQAKKQYFDLDSSIKIVVFGHTHEAKLLPFKNLNGQKTIYANSGTWIDKPQGTYPSRTFVVITKPKSNSPVQTVNLYQYSDNNIIQWEDGKVITNLASN